MPTTGKNQFFYKYNFLFFDMFFFFKGVGGVASGTHEYGSKKGGGYK